MSLSWPVIWTDRCSQMDKVPGSTFSSKDASFACFSLYAKGHNAGFFDFGKAYAEDPDPTQYLWFGNAVSTGGNSHAEQAYNSLVNFVNHCYTNENEFHDVINGLFDNWGGKSANSCRAFVGAITDFIEAQQRAAQELAACIMSYCSVVASAQQDIATLMLSLESAVDQQEKADKKAEQSSVLHDLEAVGIGTLALVAGAVTAGTGTAAVIGLAATFAGAIGTIAQTEYDGKQAEIDTSKGWDGIDSSYKSECLQVRNNLGAQLSGEMLHTLQGIQLTAPPQLPDINPG